MLLQGYGTRGLRDFECEAHTWRCTLFPVRSGSVVLMNSSIQDGNIHSAFNLLIPVRPREKRVILLPKQNVRDARSGMAG
jgi:hypothetical protein